MHSKQFFHYFRLKTSTSGPRFLIKMKPFCMGKMVMTLTLWPLSNPPWAFFRFRPFSGKFSRNPNYATNLFYLWFLSFVFWFPPFFVFSLFLFPVWETENNEVWSFFSFSDLYPSVSPSWLSSVEKRASRLSLNPRLPEPRERIRLINSTSSSHFLTLWGDQQINSTSKNRVNPSTTRKVDARHFKSFPMRVRNGSFESAYFIRIGLIRITHSVLLMKLTHIIWVIWLISNES